MKGAFYKTSYKSAWKRLEMAFFEYSILEILIRLRVNDWLSGMDFISRIIKLPCKDIN